MTHDGRDELDDVIDGALAGYASAEPVEGLERRVLNRIRLAEAARRSAWRNRLGFAVAAVAALVLAGIVVRTWWIPPSSTLQREAQKRVAVTPAVQAPAPRAAQSRPRERVRREYRAVSTAPKRERFPTPAPMTAEEHALMAWAGRAPAEVRRVFADLQKRSEEPVAIQAIQIQPLRSDGIQ